MTQRERQIEHGQIAKEDGAGGISVDRILANAQPGTAPSRVAGHSVAEEAALEEAASLDVDLSNRRSVEVVGALGQRMLVHRALRPQEVAALQAEGVGVPLDLMPLEYWDTRRPEGTFQSADEYVVPFSEEALGINF